MCLNEKQIYASRQSKQKNTFFLFPRGTIASTRSKYMPRAEQKGRVFFSFRQAQLVEAHLPLHEKQICASPRRKINMFFLFLRGTTRGRKNKHFFQVAPPVEEKTRFFAQFFFEYFCPKSRENQSKTKGATKTSKTHKHVQKNKNRNKISRKHPARDT